MTAASARTSALSRDRLTMASKAAVANRMVDVFDTLRNHPVKEEQLLALASAFVLMTEAGRITPSDAMTYATNLMVDNRHSERRDHRFSAMKAYVERYLSNGR